jgi:hypothetical protein
MRVMFFMISGRERREIFSPFNRSRDAPQQVSMQLNSGCRIMGYAHAVLPLAAGKQYNPTNTSSMRYEMSAEIRKSSTIGLANVRVVHAIQLTLAQIPSVCVLTTRVEPLLKQP